MAYHTSFRKSFLLFLALISLLPSLWGQNPSFKDDLVYLRNGWILRGKHTFAYGDSTLKIVTEEGHTFVFPKDEVLRIEQVKRKPNLSDNFVIKDKGYTQLWSVALLWGSPDRSAFTTASSLHAQSLHGYKFNQYCTVSSGVGASLYGPGLLMPLLADVRGDLGKGSIRFHYYVQGGYALPLYDREEWWSEEEDIFTAFGGTTLDQGLGIHIFTRRKLSWVWTLSYRIQKSRELYEYSWGTTSEQEFTYRRLGFQIGMMF
ncbi:MAG: hypothetical protein AAFV07_01220 [Bacteroidota bacterium]